MVSDWILIPSLVQLCAEFDAVGPHRDRGSDGALADSEHSTSSDHYPDEDSSSLQGRDSDGRNEVHAIDIDATGPWLNGATMQKMIDYLLGECRKDNSVGKDKGRIRYMIWDHHIYQAKNGWVKENYTGSPDPHTGHAHITGEYDTGHYENDQSSYGLADKFGDDMPTAQEIAEATYQRFYKATPLNGADGEPDGTSSTPAGHLDWNQGLPSAKAGKRVYAYQLLGTVESQILLANQTLAELAGKDFTDEAAIVSGVLSGMASTSSIEELAAAILAGMPETMAKQIVDEMGKQLAAGDS